MSSAGAVSAQWLAEQLAGELQPVVPSSVAITADRGCVVMSDGSAIAATVLTDLLNRDGSGVTVEEVEGASWAVLSAVQDVASEATAEPWPAGGTALPLPAVKLDNGILYAWFGDVQRPVLALRPIALARA